ncbi:MAG: AAA family ATPase, partial [Nocardioidaceae bacterium]
TPGSVPRVLAGRDAELAQLRNDLGGVATYGHFVGRIRVETGPRGVGKTSLLKAVRQAAVEAGFITAWATARADDSLVGEIAHRLDTGLEQIGLGGGHDQGFRSRIRTLELELGIGPAKAGVELDVDGRAARRTPATHAFGDLVTTAATTARERGSAGVCILIDEIQAAPAADLRTVAYAWQELQGEVDEPPAVLIAAGLPNAPDVLSGAVTFSERFAFRPLVRLTDDDAREVLTRTAEVGEVVWEPDALAEVVVRAQGYPYFLQLYGDAMWRVAEPDPGTALTGGHLARAEDLVTEETRTMFRARWAKATPAEQRLMVVMARHGDGPVRRGEIADELGVDTRELSVQRRDLIDKGLIEAAGYGRLRFSTPGFAAFITEETGTQPS